MTFKTGDLVGLRPGRCDKRYYINKMRYLTFVLFYKDTSTWDAYDLEERQADDKGIPWSLFHGDIESIKLRDSLVMRAIRGEK